MKKIRVWKVVVLSLITLGVYSAVWYALRRDEMVRNYKVAIPHWRWPVASLVASLVAFIAFIMFSLQGYDAASPLFVLTTVLLAVILTTSSAVYIWWLWSFCKAAEKITQGRITLGWLVVYFLLLGASAAQYVLQYYFNRLPQTTAIDDKKYHPSRKFVKYSVIVMVTVFIVEVVAGGVLGALSATTEQAAPQLTKEQYSKLGRANELLKQYNDCIGKLNNDFPAEDIDTTQEAAYNTAYDHCETIRVKQNAAADAYNTTVSQ